MSEKGVIKIQTSNGAEEVPVFEPEDVELDVWRVQTDTGVGAVNLVDPEDAELDFLRMQTSQGVKAVSTVIMEVTAEFATNQQNITLTLYEDTDGDGDWENKEQIQLEAGTQSYKLDNIEGEQNHEYWIELHFENPDIEESAEVTNVTLTI